MNGSPKMTNNLKLRVLDMKSMTQLIVREEDSFEAQKYQKLEELLQKTYNISDEFETKDELEVGAYVAVYVNPYSERLPKLWLRAIIRNIFLNVGGFLYCLYLVDYGIDKCCDKLSLRRLRPHLGHAFVPYQAFGFTLNYIESRKDTKTREVIKFLKKLFNDYNDCVMARIESKNKFGSAFGRIILRDGSDLASFLVHISFAVDISGGLLNKITNQSIDENNKSISESSIRKPHSSLFIKSTNNSFVINPKVISNSSPKESIEENLIQNMSQNATNNHEMNDLNAKQSTKLLHKTSNDEKASALNCNGIVRNRRKKLSEILKTMKSNQSEEESMSETSNDMNVDRNDEKDENYYNIEIKSPNKKEVKIEEVVDWPVYESNGFVKLKLKPAGCLPPNEVFEKYFTLKRN